MSYFSAKSIKGPFQRERSAIFVARWSEEQTKDCLLQLAHSPQQQSRKQHEMVPLQLTLLTESNSQKS